MRSIARWAPSCHSRWTGFRRMFHLLWLGSKLSWESFLASLVRECWCCHYRESPCFVLEVPSLLRQNYPDCISDPRRGERSVDSHSRIILSRQRSDGSLLQNHIYRVLRQHAQNVPRFPAGPKWVPPAHSHLTPTYLFVNRKRQRLKQSFPVTGTFGSSSLSGLPGPSSPSSQ